MKIFASWLTAFALVAVVSSCGTAPNEPAPLSASADNYFFQPDLTQVYTYSQDHATTSDTLSYQTSLVNPLDPYHSYLQLKNNQAATGSGVLYYFKSEQTSDGSSLCLLANSPTDNGFVALKGTLDLDATWYADSAQDIQAVVVGKYAEYFLPGREVVYNDVVVVKYTDKSAPAGDYIVRYFARNCGLIFERTITGPNSEITDLQLLSHQGSSNKSNPDPNHDRWYNANGRYIANMRQDDLMKK